MLDCSNRTRTGNAILTSVSDHFCSVWYLEICAARSLDAYVIKMLFFINGKKKLYQRHSLKKTLLKKSYFLSWSSMCKIFPRWRHPRTYYPMPPGGNIGILSFLFPFFLFSSFLDVHVYYSTDGHIRSNIFPTLGPTFCSAILHPLSCPNLPMTHLPRLINVTLLKGGM